MNSAIAASICSLSWGLLYSCFDDCFPFGGMARSSEINFPSNFLYYRMRHEVALLRAKRESRCLIFDRYLQTLPYLSLM